jgi:hypothetical protein
MIPNLNSIIERLSSAFRIEQEIVEEENTVTLITHSYLGTKLLYSHSMSLDPLIDIAVKRLADAARSSNEHQ